MTKSLLISVLGFCIVLTATILTILYANGYTYDFSTKAVQKTGVIKISTTPSGTNILINNIKEGQSPVSVFNLNPGTYIVDAEKKGYTTWTAKIQVTGGNISLVYPILYPSNITAVRTESQNTISQSFFGKGIYAYTIPDKAHIGSDILVHTFGSTFLDIGETTTDSLDTSTLGLPSDYAIASIMFEPNNTRYILEMSGKGLSNEYFLVSLDKAEKVIRIGDLIDTTLYPTIMPGQDDNHVLISNTNSVVNLDATNGQRIILIQTLPGNQIINTSTNNSLMYYELLTKDPTPKYSLNSIQLDGTNNITITSQDSPMQQIVSTNTDYAYDIQGKGIYISYPELYSTLIQIPVISGDIIPISFSPDTKYLLYEDNLGNLYTYSIETQQSYNLNLNNKSLTYFIWDKNSRIILYSSNNPDQAGYFAIHGITFDGSNDNVLFKGLIQNPMFTLSPTDGRILFEMVQQSSDTKDIDKGIYDITIQGI